MAYSLGSRAVSNTGHYSHSFQGTRLTLVQSGFASLPASAIESYLKLNQRGWDGALTQLETYLRSETQERL